jgi:hypothetical protein
MSARGGHRLQAQRSRRRARATSGPPVGRDRIRILASSNDHDVERHIAMSDAVLERCKRMVEAGRHVVVMLDSLTRLGRAFNRSNKHANERADDVGRHRLAGARGPEADLRRRPQHRGGREPDDARHLPRRHRQPGRSGDLRGVQGHGQHGAHPRPKGRREAAVPRDGPRRQRHAQGAPAARRAHARDDHGAAPADAEHAPAQQVEQLLAAMAASRRTRSSSGTRRRVFSFRA